MREAKYKRKIWKVLTTSSFLNLARVTTTMKFLLLFLFFGVATCASIDEFVTIQSEYATNYPPGVMDGDISLVPDEEATEIVIQARQNEVEEDDEEGVVVDEAAVSVDIVQAESTTAHWTEVGCVKDHEHWEQCGPRCQQECTFQPQTSPRQSRLVCESIFQTSSCYPGMRLLFFYIRHI